MKYEVFAHNGKDQYQRGELLKTGKVKEAYDFALAFLKNNPKPWAPKGEVRIEAKDRFGFTVVAKWEATKAMTWELTKGSATPPEKPKKDKPAKTEGLASLITAARAVLTSY